MSGPPITLCNVPQRRAFDISPYIPLLQDVCSVEVIAAFVAAACLWALDIAANTSRMAENNIAEEPIYDNASTREELTIKKTAKRIAEA